MDWLNLHIPTVIRSPEYVGSSPAERGTWLSVLSYACEIECGGRLVGAGDWKDRQWQQACGVTLREVRAASRLMRFDGHDLVINGYPMAKEKQVRQARGVGKAGAMARWGKGDADRHQNGMPTGIGESMPPGMPTANAEGEGEGEGELNLPTTTTTTTTRARERVTGYDAHAVRSGIRTGNTLAIIAAFGCTVAGRESEWPAEAHGMQLGELAVVLWLAMREGQPIRQPSGLRKAREEWARLSIEDRRGIAAIAVPELGIGEAAA